MVFSAVLSVFVASVLGTAQADSFLDARSRVATHLVEEMLLSELAAAGKEDRLLVKQKDLEAMFMSLPKNGHGQLEPSTVRYALHRHFVAKYGWYVKGLDPAGSGWHPSHDAEMLKDWVPSFIQEIMERRLHGKGLDLADLASFAATLEDLIHAEGIDDLKGVYNSLSLPLDDEVAHEDFDLSLRSFLAQITVGFGRKIKGRFEVEKLEAEARDMYPEFDDIVMWTRDLHSTFLFLHTAQSNPFVVRGTSFRAAADFMKLWLHGFAAVVNPDCRIVKEQLTDMDVAGSGRVPLADFYSNADLQFHESLDYLRNLAAVEEHGFSKPRLIITNYINSASRCLPFSGYYSVCCPDECEGLIGHVEQAVQAPVSTPQQIAHIVSGLSSDTIVAPRNLSSTLLERLDDIAKVHGGAVPMHGRLFMQWMHHAFPQECPYPHEAGTTKPVGQEEWLLMHDEIDDAMVSDADKAKLIEFWRSQEAANSDGTAGLEAIPWSATEELVSQGGVGGGYSSPIPLRAVMGLIALSSFAWPLVKLGRSASKVMPEEKSVMV